MEGNGVQRQIDIPYRVGRTVDAVVYAKALECFRAKVQRGQKIIGFTSSASTGVSRHSYSETL